MAQKKTTKGLPEPVEQRGVLDRRKKETMLAVILRNPDVFQQVRKTLRRADVRTINAPYAIIYRAVDEFFREYSELPNASQLLDSCQQLIQDHPGQVGEVETEAMAGFIDLIFAPEEWGHKDLATDKSYAALALKTYKQFKEELIVSAARQQLGGDGGKVPVDVAGSLRRVLIDIDAVSTLDARSPGVLFAEGWMERPRAPCIPTGMSALDVFLGGGARKKEVALFMGPYGSCKSTLAIKCFVEGCKRAEALTRDKSNTEGLIHKVVLVTYETPPEEIQDRCLAYGANIPRQRLARMTNLSTELHREGMLEEYEQKRFRRMLEAGEQPPSEFQRITNLARLINHYGVVFDMRAVDLLQPMRGRGGIPEVSTSLQALKRKNPKLVVEIIWLDHLAAMVDQMLGAEDMVIAANTQRDLLRGSCKEMSVLLADPFDCPVMAMHQLSGEANSRGATAKFRYTDAHECKTVGMYVDFVIETGPTTQDQQQLCIWTCDKHRREPPRRSQIVRVFGSYNNVINVSNKYTVDAAARRIVAVKDMQAVEGKPAAALPAQHSFQPPAEGNH